jgi:drug/metabolite transporter (DMT)-like permease
MAAITHDSAPGKAFAPGPRPLSGLGFAVVSAASFALSGAVAKGMLESGWSSGAAVSVRVGLAALVLAWPAYRSLRGRSHLLRANLGLILTYGVIAVAGCQLAYFNAVVHLQVSMALLIEYAAPVAVMGWLWLRHAQRPGPLTVLGTVIAGIGLVLMVGVLTSGGAGTSLVGVLWALGAMLGAATYFVLSANDDNPLPPVALAASALGVGAVTLLLAGGLGLVEFRASTEAVNYSLGSVPWFVPVLVLGVLSGAVPYTTGIAAARRLGSRVASFVALIEVLFALLVAWLLLAELPAPMQFLGGAITLVGVLVVKASEVRPRAARVKARPVAG